MRQRPNFARGMRGFTIVELIIVIVITGVIAVSLAVVIRPTMDAYKDIRVRSDIADIADSALRRMVRDVRLAVPNSIRIPNASCFELVPTSAGGRYRMGPDVDNEALGCTPSATCSAPLQGGTTVTAIDSLSQLSPEPAVGDFLVINNQSTNDVYEGTNRATITNVQPAVRGRHRLTIPSMEFPTGYDGGRFTIVPASQKAVFYVCAGADGTVNSAGNGKGTLYRLSNRNFDPVYPSSCPSVTGADVVATRIKSCTFVYDPNQGATQQSGFIWMELAIARGNEVAMLAVGAHVQNAP
ncbi:MAG: prepilin-type N-terminal cleavage/methylation domain-containing protein [Rubrivivax sp.]|nr:MAG: prepilin-type N-terminal cleavage/methylation domain-containing protein [Rubrivivax sp.]